MKEFEVINLRRSTVGGLLVKQKLLPDPFEYNGRRVRRSRWRTVFSLAVVIAMGYIFTTNLVPKTVSVVSGLVASVAAVYNFGRWMQHSAARRRVYKQWTDAVILEGLLRRHSLDAAFGCCTTIDEVNRVLSQWREAQKSDTRCSSEAVRRAFTERFEETVEQIFGTT